MVDNSSISVRDPGGNPSRGKTPTEKSTFTSGLLLWKAACSAAVSLAVKFPDPSNSTAVDIAAFSLSYSFTCPCFCKLISWGYSPAKTELCTCDMLLIKMLLGRAASKTIWKLDREAARLRLEVSLENWRQASTFKPLKAASWMTVTYRRRQWGCF